MHAATCIKRVEYIVKLDVKVCDAHGVHVRYPVDYLFGDT